MTKQEQQVKPGMIGHFVGTIDQGGVQSIPAIVLAVEEDACLLALNHESLEQVRCPMGKKSPRFEEDDGADIGKLRGILDARVALMAEQKASGGDEGPEEDKKQLSTPKPGAGSKPGGSLGDPEE